MAKAKAEKEEAKRLKAEEVLKKKEAKTSKGEKKGDSK